MELLEVGPDEVIDAEIHKRFVEGSKSAYTRHFLAKEHGAEVAFLSVDIVDIEKYFVIYSIFVLGRLRKRGIASRLLEAAEMMGAAYGYEWALLRPHTLDSAYPQLALEDWYAHRGYAPLPNSQGAMVKRIRSTT